MMSTVFRLRAVLFVGVMVLSPLAVGDDSGGTAPQTEKFTLRYKFQPGETLQWKVVHRAKVRTTIADTTQVAETVSISVKTWRMASVEPDGTATFAHLVENVDMRQELTGRDKAHYNSLSDDKPPACFQDVARSVGKTLAKVTMDTRGRILRREHTAAQVGPASEGQMTVPFPEEPIPVGHTWSFPSQIEVQLERGGIKKIRIRQDFTLVGVKTGVATIQVENHILTPINNPAIETKLIQQSSSGTIRFDIDAGRIIRQQLDVDKRVIGFHTAASSLHYLTRFTEELLPAGTKTALRGEVSGARN